MQVADHRIDGDDGFAFERDDARGTRHGRTGAAAPCSSGGARGPTSPFPRASFRSTSSTRVTLSIGRMRRVDRIRLEERVPFPRVLEQDPPQVRVAVEMDPEHVEALALHPVGAAVDRRQRRAGRDARTEARLQQQPRRCRPGYPP